MLQEILIYMYIRAICFSGLDSLVNNNKTGFKQSKRNIKLKAKRHFTSSHVVKQS